MVVATCSFGESRRFVICSGSTVCGFDSRSPPTQFDAGLYLLCFLLARLIPVRRFALGTNSRLVFIVLARNPDVIATFALKPLESDFAHVLAIYPLVI